MSVVINESVSLEAYVEEVKKEAKLAFEVFRETDTLTANGTVGFVHRVPSEEKLIVINENGPFNKGKPLEATVVGFDGVVYLGSGGPGGANRYKKLFQQHPDITTISHVHSIYLGAWAQTHRTLPIRYVPVQRYNLFTEVPVYIDRRQQEVDYILDQIQINPHVNAILEANGGATVWGKQGIRKLAEFILILEEGAKLQTFAEAIGGSREYGPGVLKQQWKMANLYDQAKSEGLLRPSDF